MQNCKKKIAITFLFDKKVWIARKLSIMYFITSVLCVSQYWLPGNKLEFVLLVVIGLRLFYWRSAEMVIEWV